MSKTLCRRNGETGYFRPLDEGERNELQGTYDRCKNADKMAREIGFGTDVQYLCTLLRECGIKLTKGQRLGTRHIGPKTTPEDRRRMIVMRDERGMTLAAVGEVFGVSRQWVEQVIKRDKNRRK